MSHEDHADHTRADHPREDDESEESRTEPAPVTGDEAARRAGSADDDVTDTETDA